MTYGHGGSQLNRIVVTSSHEESAPTPTWLRLTLLGIWFVVLAMVSRYAMPKKAEEMKTEIDISNLTVKPPPPLETFIKPKPAPEQVLSEPPPPLPDAQQEQAVRKPPERQTSAPPLEEVQKPSISRSSPANLPDFAETQPRVMRERKSVDAETTNAPTARLRREMTPGEILLEKTAIARSRGTTAMDMPVAKDRAAVARRAPTADLPGAEKTTISRARGSAVMDTPAAKDRAAVARRAPSAAFTAAEVSAPQRPAVRSERSAPAVEDAAPRRVATKERSKFVGGSEGNSAAQTTIGMPRGISLQSLEICSSTQLQEENIKAILRVVGSRQSCSDEKGEFHFKGTQRISSFNLIMFPSPGRKPSNRCEELENAFKCLKTH